MCGSWHTDSTILHVCCVTSIWTGLALVHTRVRACARTHTHTHTRMHALAHAVAVHASQAGFVDVKLHGFTGYRTSPVTVSAMFTARKPLPEEKQ